MDFVIREQLTLGELITKLEALPRDARLEIEALRTYGGTDYIRRIKSIQNPHSFRGIHQHIGLEPGDRSTTVGETLQLLKDCTKETYKDPNGKEVWFGSKTPVWFAKEGECAYGMDPYPYAVVMRNRVVCILAKATVRS